MFGEEINRTEMNNSTIRERQRDWAKCLEIEYMLSMPRPLVPSLAPKQVSKEDREGERE